MGSEMCIRDSRLLASANLYFLRPTSRFLPTLFLQCDILPGSEKILLTHVSPQKTNRFTLICGFSITPHCSNHTYENLQFQRRHQFQPQFHIGTPLKTCVPRLRNNDPCVHISLCTGQCALVLGSQATAFPSFGAGAIAR